MFRNSLKNSLENFDEKNCEKILTEGVLEQKISKKILTERILRKFGQKKFLENFQ